MDEKSFELLINNVFYKIVTKFANVVITDKVIEEITETLNNEVDKIYRNHGRVRPSKYVSPYVSFILQQMHDLGFQNFKFPQESDRKPLDDKEESENVHELRDGDRTFNSSLGDSSSSLYDDMDQYDPKEESDVVMVDLTYTTDPEQWATHFIEFAKKYPNDVLNHSILTSWFFYALSVGENLGSSKELPPAELKDSDGYFVDLLDNRGHVLYNFRFVSLQSAHTWLELNKGFMANEGVTDYKIFVMQLAPIYIDRG